MIPALLALALSCRAADVVLIAEDNKILQQIADGFRSAYPGSVEAVPFQPGAMDKAKAASPKVVVALGSAAAKQAKESLSVPVLYGGVLNPKALGLEHGVPMAVPLKRQYAAVLKGLGDRGKKLGVIYKDDNVGVAQEAAEAAAELKIALKASPVAGDNVAAALKALETDVEAIWMPLDPAVAGQAAFRAIVAFCVSRKVPLIVPAPSYVKQGGMMSVSMPYADMGAALAAQAKAVAGGATLKAAAAKAPAADEITVNMAVTKQIGVSLSSDFLSIVKSKIE